MLREILLFAHVLSAFLYLLAHGGSAAVAYRVRRETSAERVRALLDLSRSTKKVSNLLFLSLVLFGIALGFQGHWWAARWLWTSIILLFVVLAVMGRLAGPYFMRIRQAVGPMGADGAWQGEARESSDGELARAVAAGNAGVITALSMGGWAVILWLMLFKPF